MGSDGGHAARDSEPPERRLLAIQRRMELADLVKQDPVVTVDDLARRYNVSPQTIRRDFQAMEERGLLTRTYGGAITRVDNPLQMSHEAAFRAREEEQAAEKQAIAVMAATLIQPHAIVIFDASTSVLQLARALHPDVEITAIVNALPIAMELSRRPNVVVTAVGGTLRQTSLSFTGPISEASLRRLYADVAFISARGFSIDRGLTEANPYESALKEMMVANATRVVALIDSSKLGRTALSPFAETTSIDVVVTDSGADQAIVSDLREIGIEVCIAEVASNGGR
jgi:DeoR/GlpR family transcriptional regulator of sugar metabolism